MPKTPPTHAEIRAALTERLSRSCLALMPQAALLPLSFFDDSEVSSGSTTLRDGVAEISVRGVLFQRAWRYGSWTIVDGYDAILERVESAIEAGAECLFFRVDSPGGMCAGLERFSADLRSLLDATGIPSVTYVDELCASAACRIAVTTDAVYVPPTGRTGSIGVIATGLNVAGALEKEGMIAVVAAHPKGKAALHPYLPIEEGAKSAFDDEIEALAIEFASFVGSRRGMSTKDVLALDAQCFTGEMAVKKGLADGVMGYEAAFQEAVKRKRNVDKTDAKDRAGKALLPLLALGGLAAESLQVSPEAIEAAAKETARLAELGKAVEGATGQKGESSIALIGAWKEGAARVPALENRVKVEALQGRHASKYPPVLAFAVAPALGADGKPNPLAGMPDPSSGPHPHFAGMSLAVFDATADAALQHPATKAPPTAAQNTGALSDAESKMCASTGLDPAIYLKNKARIMGHGVTSGQSHS